jgi:hypothetical protein
MKLIKLFFVLFFIFIINSCTDENNPVSPTFENNYLGGIGTERTYKETEYWLQAYSDIPYFTVPESLLSKVSLTALQLQSGVVYIRDYTEFIEPIGDAFYTSWNLPLPKEHYLQKDGSGTSYSLKNELDSLLLNKTYSVGILGVGQDIYRITSDEVLTVSPQSMEAINPSCTYIKNHLQIGDSWVIWKQIDTVNNTLVMERIAEVVHYENINVIAGNFTAYKIKLSSKQYITNTTFDLGFEYFVPDVGLVLKESDMNVFQWNSGTNTTIHFRQIIREELVSYSFVK